MRYTRGMDFSSVDFASLRWLLTLGFVGVVLGGEWLVPFRTPIQSKLEHVSTNLIIFGGNSVITQLLAGWAVLVWSSYLTNQTWGVLNYLRLGQVPHIILSVILLDLVNYWIHRSYHDLPFFWRFHRAHHSDLDMDATTSIRFHLGEALMTAAIKGLTVLSLGVSPAGFLISESLTLTVGLFSHANVRLSKRIEPVLRMAIVTPAMHWIHHSRRIAEHNSNLGAVFSGWDRLFGSYCTGIQQSQITFGLDEYPKPEDLSMLRFYRIPFDPPCRRIP